MMQRLRKFLALPSADRWLTMEAAVCLMLAQLLLAVLPFRWIAIGLGPVVRRPADRGVEPVDPMRQAQARQIGRAVERAARHLPWTVLCLPQALAARGLLGRRGIAATVYFGMALSDEKSTVGGHRMLAHAWVTVGTIGVVGMPLAEQFSVIACFTREMAREAAE